MNGVKRPHSYTYTHSHIYLSKLHIFKGNPEFLSCDSAMAIFKN